MHKLFGWGLAGLLFAAVPSSTNYTLRNYDIGSGGGSSSSTNYRLNGTSGTQTGNTQSSATYTNNSGLASTTNSNVPPAPAFTNPSSYYDRLRLVLNTGGNPADTKYLIAISTDNFATVTNYVQTDNSVGTSGASTNYQTYAAWGGASGFLILGLNPSTTYQVKVKAMQGGFTETAFGPTASAATVATSLSVSLATTATSTPPFAVGFAPLVADVVTNSTSNILLGFSTNALNGGNAYVRDQSNGLFSTLASFTIGSVNANLSNGTSYGYGAQVSGVTQASGGPLTSTGPYDGTGDTVGQLQSSLQPILATTAPVTSAQGTIVLKVKARTIYPSTNDYSDRLTFVVAAAF